MVSVTTVSAAADRSKPSQLHGDLVTGLAATTALHWYGYKALTWYDTDLYRSYHPPLPLYIPYGICLFIIIAVCGNFIAWSRHHHGASIVGFLGTLLAFLGIDYFNWPHPEERTAMNKLVWLLLITTANQPLSFHVKLSLGLIATTAYVALSYFSPHYTVQGNFPVMFGSFAIYVLIHYESYRHQQRSYDSIAAQHAGTRNRDRFRIHVATVLLLGYFAHHVATQMIQLATSPEAANEASFNILKAGLVGAIGLVAAGAFRDELDTHEQLEAVVAERATKIAQQAAQIHQQADDLRQAGLALQASETAMAITDEHRSIQWLNPALQRLTGKSKDCKLLHMSIEDALCPSDDDKDKLNRCFQDSGSSEEEIEVHGKIIHVQVSLSPHSPELSGEPSGNRFVVVLKDITETRALAEAKRIAQHEGMISRAMHEAMETLTHELRTPLQGIMGMTSLMLNNRPDDLPDDIKEPLAIVMVSSRLLLTLINNILDMRKCDANMMNEFELSAVPAKPALSDAVDFCRPLASISDVQLEASFADADAESAIVLSDSLRIQQVGINLISNAIKYSPTGSTVCMSVKIMSLADAEEVIKHSLASGGHQSAWDGADNADFSKCNMRVLVVSVIDQGQGIDEDKKDGLFKKFTMLGESKERTDNARIGQPSGTGLGLNLCDKFVHRMKGNIWATNNVSDGATDSPQDNGACFSFYLPIHVGDDVCPQPTLPKVPSHVLLSPKKMVSAPVVFADHTGLLAPFCATMSDVRVLGVDDTLINLKVLDKMLKLVGVGTIRLAKSGEEALGILEKEEFDLVISDLQMPGGMSGTELSLRIRNGDLDFKPAVVGLTAEFSSGLDRRCAASGMVQVLHKPITMEALKGFMTKLLVRLPHPDLQ